MPSFNPLSILNSFTTGIKAYWPSSSNRSVFYLLLALSPTVLAAPTSDQLKEISDFSQLANKPVVLVVRSATCGYCQRLEQEQLLPLYRQPQYQERIQLYRLTLEKTDAITHFNKQQQTAREFAQQYKAELTPTVLLLDHTGKEIAKRLVGYNSPDYYGFYLEQAIKEAETAIKKPK